MGRQKFNKRDHIQKSNRILENRTVITEQTGSCWLSSVVAAGGGSVFSPFNPGGSYFEMYCHWWFNVGAGPGIGNFPLVPNPWEWEPTNPYYTPNDPPFSTPGQPTGTGASNFIDCGCDLSGNTAPNWFTTTTEDTWDCVKQVSWEVSSPDEYKCILRTDGSGQFTTLQDCKSNCDTTGHILTPDGGVGPVDVGVMVPKKKPPTKDETSDKKDKLNEEVNKMKKLWNYNK